jgi:hypothetical protein
MKDVVMPAAAMTPDAAYAALSSGTATASMHVNGVLDFAASSGRQLPERLPDRLRVDVLNLSGQALKNLPAELSAYEVNLSGTPITQLPENIHVTSRLDLTGCDRLESLPKDLTVGTLVLRGCTALPCLPERLDVWFLDLSECWALEKWPREANIRGGHLRLQGCSAVRDLPPYVNRLSALNVRGCANLTSLPPDLVVTGWIDVAHSGLTREDLLPTGLSTSQLRWAGVDVDRRIAFRPSEISLDEILQERNAERRRVLLDRFGYGRFLQEAAAEVLDSDRDPGGKRQLVRVMLPDDEDLVAMSCYCPSTGRQYMIRVPPQTPTCRHAAAWIAGFDNPDDYRPLVET